MKLGIDSHIGPYAVAVIVCLASASAMAGPDTRPHGRDNAATLAAATSRDVGKSHAVMDKTTHVDRSTFDGLDELVRMHEDAVRHAMAPHLAPGDAPRPLVD